MFDNPSIFDRHKYDFPVEKRNIYLADGTMVPPSQGMHVVRTDTNQPIAQTTETFNLTPVTDIIDPVEAELIALFGTNVKAKTTVKNMCFFEVEVSMPMHAYDIDGTGPVTPTWCFRTSYDSSYANKGMAGAWRSKCWNDLVDGNKYSQVSHKHTKGFSTKTFIAKMNKALSLMSGTEEKYRNWFDTHVHRDDVVSLLSETICGYSQYHDGKRKVKDRMLSGIMRTYDEEVRQCHGRGHYDGRTIRQVGSLWTLYNALTAWSTHTESKRTKESRNPFTAKDNREGQVIKVLNSKEWKSLEDGA